VLLKEEYYGNEFNCEPTDQRVGSVGESKSANDILRQELSRVLTDSAFLEITNFEGSINFKSSQKPEKFFAAADCGHKNFSENSASSAPKMDFKSKLDFSRNCGNPTDFDEERPMSKSSERMKNIVAEDAM